MTRREFAGWMVASVVAMVAGSRVWRLFRQAAERGEAYGVVTEVNQALGTITVEWTRDQHGRRWSIIRGQLVVNRIGELTV